MTVIELGLVLAALICFLLAIFPTVARVNLTAAGLALLTLALLLMSWGGRALR